MTCEKRNDVKGNISKYGNKNACYDPFIYAISYPPNSQEFVRVGWLKICPTLSARDYKDPKVVCVKK